MEKKCKYCGGDLYLDNLYKGRSYCSDQCNLLASREKARKRYKKQNIGYGICPVCKKRFKKKTMVNIYCSNYCSNYKRRTLETIKPLVREYFLEKANFKCEECGTINNHNLELHHIIPLYKGGKDVSENIIVLCSKCHKKKHKIL